MIEKYRIYFLIGIVSLAAILRLYALNWDQGYHLHPDERAIVLSVVSMHFPGSIEEFLSIESSWNPKFFAYGSFPFYLLKIVGDLSGTLLLPIFARYDGINLVGRFLSAFFDVGTIIMLYKLGRRFFTSTVGLLAAFFYTISVLPIQLSHFYAVDTILTFFATVVLYLSIKLEEKRQIRTVILCGICFGLALATKVSAIILTFPIAIALFYTLVNKKPKHHIHSFRHALLRTSGFLLLLVIGAIITFSIVEPYAIIDHARFLLDTTVQSEMTKDAFVFPYTLQYIFKKPYIYELSNIFFFGLGPLLTILSLTGFIYFLYNTIHEKTFSKQARNLIILSYVIVYFIVVGSFKVGFMRYLLPLYPMFCLFSALSAYTFGKFLHRKLSFPLFALYSLLFAGLLLVWPLSYMTIYNTPNTRVQATDWIVQNIPPGSVITIEHWDDALPLQNASSYSTETLPLYDQDTIEKWQQITYSLHRADYIIVASNRLYTPLMKLTDCDTLPAGRCYVQTSEYYKNLFSGKIGFRKVAEFATYPKFEIGNMKFIINDESADESFTVYDHPKVMIFKKQK